MRKLFTMGALPDIEVMEALANPKGNGCGQT